MNETQLDDLGRDALSELFNIGLGRAGRGLHELTGEEVRLSAPRVDLVDRDQLLSHLAEILGERVMSIDQSAKGPFDAQAFLLFPESSMMALARALLGPETPVEDLPDLSQEALSEMGNIILNAAYSSFADLLGVELMTGMPNFRLGAAPGVLGMVPDLAVHILAVRVDFQMPKLQVEGYVLILLDVVSVDVFRDAVHRLVIG